MRRHTPRQRLPPLWAFGLLQLMGCGSVLGGSDAGSGSDTCPLAGADAPWDDADQDGYVVGDDCDDEVFEVNPAAREVCDGIDNNCDGKVDDASADDATVWYLDADGDGHAGGADSVIACEAPTGYFAVIDDCDDTRPERYFGADDPWYDGMDEDCAENDDYDQDGDGQVPPEYSGDPTDGVPGTGALPGLDCNDEDPTVYAGAYDIPDDGIDQDCDGVDATSVVCDMDGDGWDSVACGGMDCDDTDATVNPGAVEIWYDGVDENCDGRSDDDQDDDGHESDAYGGDDCNDVDATVHPGAYDIPDDGIDQDCDGVDATSVVCDVDGDGWDSVACGGIDCDDTNAAVNPGAIEIWYDGVDENCDGRSDDDQDNDGHESDTYGGDDCNDVDANVYLGAVDTPDDGIDQDCDGVDATSVVCDVDGDGWDSVACGGIDCDDTNAAVNPGAIEIWYDGVDENCDGRSDDDQDNDGHDSDAFGGDDCNDVDATVHPGAYDIPDDGIDQDCDGVDATSVICDVDGDGWDNLGCGGFDCDDTNATVNPGAPEICNGLDENCNGVEDEVGATWNVPGDFASIQAAIDGVAELDVIEVDPGTYAENLDFHGHSVRVRGTTGPWYTTIDGGGAGSVVAFQSGELNCAELDGFTLTNGTGTPYASGFQGGGIFIAASDPALRNLRVLGNSVSGASYNDGGGIYIGGGSVTIDNTLVFDNFADYGAGGIQAVGATLRLQNVAVIGNAGLYGAGIHVFGVDLSATNVLVTDNHAPLGSGFYIRGSTATLSNVTLYGNGDEGVYLFDSTASFSGVLIAGNTDGDSVAGAIEAIGSPVSLVYGDVFGNSTPEYSGLADPSGTNGNVAVDPAFIDTSAANALDWNLHLGTLSGAANAGDPALLDPDLTRCDIGAYGGLGADAWDLDGDGYSGGQSEADCNDNNGDVHPGAADPPADGVDRDCDGVD